MLKDDTGSDCQTLFAPMLLMLSIVVYPLSAAADTSVVDAPDAPEAVTEIQEEQFQRQQRSPIELNYFGILYGPSVGAPNEFQPDEETGKPNPELPVIIKNYLTLSYNLNEDVFVGATGTWNWQPVRGNDLAVRDPFLKLGHGSLLSSDQFNLYADIRVHLPVTAYSKEQDLLVGFQTFQNAIYQFQDSRWSIGTYASARYNHFGSQGFGSNVELYLGPNVNYRISSKLALTVLYEMGASHPFGDSSLSFDNDGTDLEPGLIWNVTDKLTLSPYLNFFTGRPVTWDSTSFGMTMALNVL